MVETRTSNQTKDNRKRSIKRKYTKKQDYNVNIREWLGDINDFSS